MQGSLTVQKNDGITVGASGDGSFKVESGVLTIRNNLTNGDIKFKTDRQGAIQTALHVDASQSYVGLWKDNPTANLDVAGDVRISGNLTVEGNSLLIGADLTGKAFTRSIFGEYGQYIVAIGLLLFAFSTAIAWSYYGDRATVHLFGEGWVLYYRIIYVGAFFTAAIICSPISPVK